ncbi:MAG TPA: class 1 fructose-bisphosphatase [Planctomycetota bacterium]|nr:class 1 fructose-bisphosphatase [Planctomycetota bacterium]
MAESKHTRGVTLSQHIAHQQKAARATGEFSAILSQIALAAKIIARALSQGALFNRQGYAGTNVLGSDADRVDVFAHEAFINSFKRSPHASMLVTEDMEDSLHKHTFGQNGRYAVFVDALNGSLNLDVNGVLGSIFSVYRIDGEKSGENDLLRKGTEQVGAGYIVYGPSTQMVYSSGDGVHLYTLDVSIGEFLITQENLRFPERGLTYACNEAHFQDWPEHVRKYIDHLRRRDPRSSKYYSSRFAGALVFNFHRTLLEGGVCLYPETVNPTETKAKRLMFECNPLAFIADQAGGQASSGTEKILKMQPATLHERTTLVIGSPYEVALFEDFASGRRA